MRYLAGLAYSRCPSIKYRAIQTITVEGFVSAAEANLFELGLGGVPCSEAPVDGIDGCLRIREARGADGLCPWIGDDRLLADDADPAGKIVWDDSMVVADTSHPDTDLLSRHLDVPG